jgi:hypothetical protein
MQQYIYSCKETFLFMTVLGELQYIPGAQAAIREERSRVIEEREAFRTFGEDVASFSPATDCEVTHQTVSIPRTGTQTAMTDRVREVYRKTVMDVSHFEAEYDESLATNMTQELGTAVTEAVTSRQSLTPPLKQSLVYAAQAARTSRSEFIEKLDREADALAKADAVLTQLGDSLPPMADDNPDPSFSVLCQAWEAIGECQRECDQLCRERQDQLSSRRRAQSQDDPLLCTYLYEALDVDHPILADTMSHRHRLREKRRSLLSTLSSDE